MTIKNEKGHEDELFGFRIQTELEVEGGTMWCVKIYRKPSEAGMPPLLAHEARGFGYEGEALDFGQDWTMEHRPYIPEVKASGMRGFIGQVLNESGFAEYKTTECPNEDEAQALIDAWISAKRLHDQKIIAERCRVRANARLIESDFHAVETEALAAIEAAKATVKEVAAGRAQLRKDLACPQMDFNFVAELERVRVQTIGKRKREQTDLEKHIAAKTAKPEAQPGAAP